MTGAVPGPRSGASRSIGALPDGAFRRPYRIRFSDCDPAGIVFYPQYFVMLNGLVEDWFDGALGLPYRVVIGERRIGLPSVRLEVEFESVSRHGDDVELALGVERIGRASITLCHAITGARDRVRRMAMRQVLVATSLDTHRALEIPADVRAAILRHMPTAAAPAAAV